MILRLGRIGEPIGRPTLTSRQCPVWTRHNVRGRRLMSGFFGRELLGAPVGEYAFGP
jgi:hypothetical protein